MADTALPLLPTTVVGSYPQPDWLVDRDQLLTRLPPRVRARDLWRIPEPFLEEAQQRGDRRDGAQRVEEPLELERHGASGILHGIADHFARAALVHERRGEDAADDRALLEAVQHLQFAGLVASSADQPGDELTNRRYWRVRTFWDE